MKWFFLVWLIAVPTLAAPRGPIRYPRISAVKGPGATLVTGHGDGRFAAKETVPLIEKAAFESGDSAEIHIELDDHRSIVILPSTQVEFPGIRPEDGAVPLIILKSGRLRWSATKTDHESLVKSDFFEISPGVGDFVFRSQRQPPEAEVQVLSGTIDFSATNAEETTHVKAGARSLFIGVLEDGEVAYDVLLQGKRIPRGHLQPAQKVPEKELRSYDQEKRRREEARRREKAKAERQRALEAKMGFLCSAPKAKFNQCAVTCEGNPRGAPKCLLERKGVRCVRRRCNANGEWAENSALSADDARAICGTTPVVGPCP